MPTEGGAAIDQRGTNPVPNERFPSFPQLDGFRGLAILLVLVEHTLRHSLGLNGFWNHFGNLGVVLFFGLSGFLITGLLCAESSRDGGIDLRAFYTRRFLRIVPAMWALLVIVAGLTVVGAVTDVPWKGFAEAALFVRNIFGRDTTLSHLWSVSIEVQYYIAWPLAFLVFRPKGARVAGWFIILGVIAWRTWAILSHRFPPDSPVIYLRTDFRLDAIMAGSLLALSRHLGNTFWRDPAPKWAAWMHPIWMAPALVAWSAVGLDLPHVSSQWITGQVALGAGLLAACARFPRSIFSSICSQAWLRALGRWSYSLYLWQQIFLVTKSPDWGWFRHFPANLALTFGAALLSHYLIELPCLRMKSKWRKNSA
jgi:peptidoglycan/LPS O-acetylase OafA/YrhL